MSYVDRKNEIDQASLARNMRLNNVTGAEALEVLPLLLMKIGDLEDRVAEAELYEACYQRECCDGCRSAGH